MRNLRNFDMINIAIADDHHQVREAWNFILSSDGSFNIVALCHNGQEAIEAARRCRPDVFLMDINMQPVSGIEAAAIITAAHPGVRIVAMSVHAEPVYVRRMLQAGATAYVTKNSSFEEVCEAIREAHAGNRYLCHEVRTIMPELV